MRQTLPVIVLATALLSAHPSQGGPGQVPPRSDLAARAEDARAAGRMSEAIALYRDALVSDPRWAEGWWRLGTLLYDTDSYADAAAAFETCTELEPGIGTAWVMLGLAEFKLGSHDDALSHIQKGRRLGASADPQFRRVMLYHEGVLLLGKSEFERAQEVLGSLSAEGVDDADLKNALGMSVLRLRPFEVPDGSALRAVVVRAGLAEQLASQKKLDEALRAYQTLAADYPHVRNVHYALGRYFVGRSQPELAMAAYEREIAEFRDHVPARLGIAAIKAVTDPAAALRYAEEAVALNPRVPLGHYLLGTLLLHTADTPRAIAELELARSAVPDDPGVLRRARPRLRQSGPGRRCRERAGGVQAIDRGTSGSREARCRRRRPDARVAASLTRAEHRGPIPFPAPHHVPFLLPQNPAKAGSHVRMPHV